MSPMSAGHQPVCCCVHALDAGGGSQHTGILLEPLPPIAHVHMESDRDTLRWPLQRLATELREQRPGHVLIAQHMAHMMLVQALRLVLSEEDSGGVGWLYALADPQIGDAIGAARRSVATLDAGRWRRWRSMSACRASCWL
ncbi:cupin domain-containing protein [Duganella callida]|uniref:cupin domain-containing protein n=1 Tax=Duganella callida TaxID=2561932 RepID=UPI00197AB026|nr:cupin domain-containing protein [Duganella callida]